MADDDFLLQRAGRSGRGRGRRPARARCRRAWKIAIRSPLAPWIAGPAPRPAAPSTGIGGRSGKPVVNCTPEKACAMRSSPRSAGERAGLPERRDAQDGEARVARAASASGAEARRLEAPRPQVLHERVGRGEERREPAARGERPPARPRPSTCRGSPTGSRASPRPASAGPRRRIGEPAARLDLDHGGPEVGEQAARHLARERLGQLDHDHAGERAAARRAGQPGAGCGATARSSSAGRLTRSRRCGPRCRRATSP